MAAAALAPKRRPLSAEEVRRLERSLGDAEAVERGAPRAALITGAGATTALWAATLLASDAPAAVITGFWLVVGAAITVWVMRDRRREVVGIAAPLRSALRRAEADEYRIEATAFAAFEEVEDEGAAYAFQVEADRMVFLGGQEFYPEGDFPSLAFSLVYPLTERGTAADLMIVCHEPRAQPARILPREVKAKAPRFPGTLDVVSGTLGELETILGREA